MLEEYVAYLRSVRGLSEHTIHAYRRDLSAFLDFLSERKVEVKDVDLATARVYVARLSKSGLKASSINRALSSIRGFYRFNESQGYFRADPFLAIRSMKTDKTLPDIFFQREIEELLGSIAPGDSDFSAVRDRTIFEILYSTGCRVSEVIGMNTADIDTKRRVAMVHGKGKKDRLVFIGKSAAESMREYLPHRSSRLSASKPADSVALFVNERGGRLTRQGVTHIISKRLSEAGVQKHVTPHTFRHSFATHLLDEGAGIRSVQELLGHASLSTTQIYTHLGIERLKRVYRDAHPHGTAHRNARQTNGNAANHTTNETDYGAPSRREG